MQIKQSLLKRSIKKYNLFFYLLFSITYVCAMEEEKNHRELALMEYITQRNIAGIKQILSGPEPINVNFTSGKYANHTPLCEAVGLDMIDVVKLLLAHPAIDVDQEGGNGYRPLHIAAMHGMPREVAALCKRGASLYVQNNEGNTPFHEAIGEERLHTGVVMALVDTVPTQKIETIALLRRTVFTFLCCCHRHKQLGESGVLTKVPREIVLMICQTIVRASILPDFHEFAFDCMRSDGIFRYLVRDQLAQLNMALALRNKQNKTALDAIWRKFDYATDIKVILDPDRDTLRNSLIEDYVKKKYNKINLAAKAHNSELLQMQPTEDTATITK